MSHFSVLVAVKEATTEAVEAALQPYHEFECTGQDDQYVQDVEEISEYKERYESETKSRLKAQDGSIHCPYDEQFYRDPTDEESQKIGSMAGSGCGSGLSWHSKDWRDGKGYRTKVKFTPEGYELQEVPVKDFMSFIEFIQWETERPTVREGSLQVVDPDSDSGQVKYGYIKVNEAGEVVSVINRTNPNKRWDWWVVGGRWSNRLRLKPSGSDEIVYADDARKSDVDFEAMFNDGKAESENTWLKAMNGVEGSWETWTSLLKKAESGELTIAQCREQYHAQEWLVKAKSNLGDKAHFFSFDDLLSGKDAYAQQGGEAAIRTFAILHDGNWYEKGEMGWENVQARIEADLYLLTTELRRVLAAIQGVN